MVADKDGAVLLCQHGNRRIVRINGDRQISVLVDRFEGRRLNSPNDLVYKSDGSLYFTDPPYGLLKQDEDPRKELKFNGVFRLADGKLQVVIKDLTRPNGIAFSPDQKILYIANSDEKRKVWMRYDVQPDGSVKNGRVKETSTAPGLVVSGCFRRKVSIWGQSSRPKRPPTVIGVTATRCISPLGPACIASSLPRRANGRCISRNPRQEHE
jgi:sugar lactone lactonase YvrE